MEDREIKEQFDLKLRELGTRYLARTAHEIDTLRKLLEQPAIGREAIAQLAQAAHRIHGSGAMLGFRAITDCVRPLNAFMNRSELETLNSQERDYVRRELECVAEAVEEATRQNLEARNE